MLEKFAHERDPLFARVRNSSVATRFAFSDKRSDIRAINHAVAVRSIASKTFTTTPAASLGAAACEYAALRTRRERRDFVEGERATELIFHAIDHHGEKRLALGCCRRRACSDEDAGDVELFVVFQIRTSVAESLRIFEELLDVEAIDLAIAVAIADECGFAAVVTGATWRGLAAGAFSDVAAVAGDEVEKFVGGEWAKEARLDARADVTTDGHASRGGRPHCAAFRLNLREKAA